MSFKLSFKSKNICIILSSSDLAENSGVKLIGKAEQANISKESHYILQPTDLINIFIFKNQNLSS